jgi:hypothetical protein
VLAIVWIAPPAAADPALIEARSDLKASVACPASFVNREHNPVLLVHGTASTPEENWGWNYARVLPSLGYDVCTVRLPNRALDDIQRSAEYVVYAIRRVSALSHVKIDVIGHSQGGMLPRWALKFWPGLRRLVDDFVALAPPNHGATGADVLCPTTCAPAAQQQKTTSNFMRALNTGSPRIGVDYTIVYSLTDELVQPALGTPTAVVEGASNILIQDLCPGRPVHHAGLVHDAVAFHLLMDALRYRGPADAARFDPAGCAETSFPGVSAVDVVAGNVLLYGNAYPAFGTYPASEEPPLRPYARHRP